MNSKCDFGWTPLNTWSTNHGLATSAICSWAGGQSELQLLVYKRVIPWLNHGMNPYKKIYARASPSYS
jgi:hypothetical protein